MTVPRPSLTGIWSTGTSPDGSRDPGVASEPSTAVDAGVVEPPAGARGSVAGATTASTEGKTKALGPTYGRASPARVARAGRGSKGPPARHRRELAYASAAQVARELGVSASTVVRFAQQLGYDGWPSLQRALREELRESDRLVGLPPESAHFLDEYVEVQVRNVRFLATQ